MATMELWVQEKTVCNITNKINVIKPKVLEWAARSNSRDIKLLVAEIKSHLRQKVGRNMVDDVM